MPAMNECDIDRGIAVLKERTETSWDAGNDASFIKESSVALAVRFILAFAFLCQNQDTRSTYFTAHFIHTVCKTAESDRNLMALREEPLSVAALGLVDGRY
jgi:hypothetical protein